MYIKMVNPKQYYAYPNQGLLTYMGRVKKGSDEDIRTPFAGKKPRDEIISEWDQEFRKYFPDIPRFNGLAHFENLMKEDIGPLSIMKPLSDRMDDIANYFSMVKMASQPLDSNAINLAKVEFRRVKNCRIKSILNTVRDMKLNTNSGLPYFDSERSHVIGKSIPYVISWSESGDPMLTLNDKVYYICAVLGWRGQEGGLLVTDVKQRVVWLFPFNVNIEELRVYQPAISATQNSGLLPSLISNESVDIQVTRLFDTSEYILNTDFSKFDQHFNPRLQEGAYQMLGYMFQNDSHINEWLKNIFPIKYNLPLLIDTNKIVYGAHGMGSGSGGTNFDETLTHRILQHEAALRNHQTLNRYSMCLGDDGILSYPGITIDQVYNAYTSHGLEMKLDNNKQHYSNCDTIYLRRWHGKHYRQDGICRGVYSTYRALGRMMGQERFYDSDIWSKEMVELRYYSILENIEWHPLREKFADFCMERDKYSLGLGIPGFLDNINKYAKEAIDNIPDIISYNYLGELYAKGANGISNWWIVRYLNSKRKSR